MWLSRRSAGGKPGGLPGRERFGDGGSCVGGWVPRAGSEPSLYDQAGFGQRASKKPVCVGFPSKKEGVEGGREKRRGGRTTG